MEMVKRKICLLGAFAVGKTSLVERFVNDRFDEKYLTTVGTSISQKIMPPARDVRSGRMFQHMFLIWDIAGLEKFDAMVKNYYRGASGAMAIADLTRPDTIDALAQICESFMSVNPRAALIIVGNKIDLIRTPDAQHAELNPLASAYATEILLTSAKTGDGVEQAFNVLGERIKGTNG